MPKSSNRRSISWRRLPNGRRGRGSDGAAVSVVTGIFEVSSAMTHTPKCRWERKLVSDCSRATCYATGECLSPVAVPSTDAGTVWLTKFARLIEPSALQFSPKITEKALKLFRCNSDNRWRQPDEPWRVVPRGSLEGITRRTARLISARLADSAARALGPF